MNHVQIECILMSHEFVFRKENGVFILKKFTLFLFIYFFITYVLNAPKIIKLCMEKKLKLLKEKK